MSKYTKSSKVIRDDWFKTSSVSLLSICINAVWYDQMSMASMLTSTHFAGFICHYHQTSNIRGTLGYEIVDHSDIIVGAAPTTSMGIWRALY